MLKAERLIRTAYDRGYAVGQFNVYNMESIQAVAAAAEAENSPALIGTSMGSLRHAGIGYLAVMAKHAIANAAVPLMLHADHTKDLDTIKACIALGWASVMIDASEKTPEDNIALTQEVVRLAHNAGVAVEAQIGETWDEETGEGRIELTTPDEAKAFVDATGIDYLAVSIGNTPGVSDGEAQVDLSLLRQIAEVVPVPIVLHGGTSTPDETVQQAIAEGGVAKVNIDTAIRQSFTGTWSAVYNDEQTKVDAADPRKVMTAAREKAVDTIRAKMRLFGSKGKAHNV